MIGESKVPGLVERMLADLGGTTIRWQRHDRIKTLSALEWSVGLARGGDALTLIQLLHDESGQPSWYASTSYRDETRETDPDSPVGRLARHVRELIEAELHSAQVLAVTAALVKRLKTPGVEVPIELVEETQGGAVGPHLQARRSRWHAAGHGEGAGPGRDRVRRKPVVGPPLHPRR